MKVKVCVVQDNPVFFNLEKSIEKVNILTAQAVAEKAKLVLFPESFLPGYPRGFSFGATVGNRTDEGRILYSEYYRNSLDLDGPHLKRLEKIASEYSVFLVIGITEKVEMTGSLFCSMVYISPDQGFLGVHRKLKPTGSERIIWSEGNGDDLLSFDTELGKIGGLICWENLMPLARMAMYKQGIEIYLAPTADPRDTWTVSMQHIALEGRCFVLGCNQFFTKSMYPDKYQKLVQGQTEIICRGGSMVVSPFGKILAGPLFNTAGMLFAELDMEEIVRSKLDFDVIGHYARDDVFEYKIKCE